MPLFYYCMRSKSSAVRDTGFEAMAFWTYMNQSEKPIYESLGHLTKDDVSIQLLLKNLLKSMG